MNLEVKVSRRNFVFLIAGAAGTVVLSGCAPQRAEGAKLTAISKDKCTIQDPEQELLRLAAGSNNDSQLQPTIVAQIEEDEKKALQQDAASLIRKPNIKDRIVGLANAYRRIGDWQNESAKELQGKNAVLSEEYKSLADCNYSRGNSLYNQYVVRELLKLP